MKHVKCTFALEPFQQPSGEVILARADQSEVILVRAA